MDPVTYCRRISDLHKIETVLEVFKLAINLFGLNPPALKLLEITFRVHNFGFVGYVIIRQVTNFFTKSNLLLFVLQVTS